jgi:hypothetical protein
MFKKRIRGKNNMFKHQHTKRFILFSIIAALLIGMTACVPGTVGGQSTQAVDPNTTEGLVQSTEPGKPGPAENDPPSTGKTPIPLPEGPLTVAYVKDSNIWVWTPDRGPVQLTTGKNVIDLRLSDDGKTAAYFSEVGELQYELWAIETDGSNDRRLVSVDELKAIVPDALSVAPNKFEWVPGTRRLAYSTRVVQEAPGYLFNGDLYVVDADSLEKQTVFQPGSAGQFYYSPDGQKIAMVFDGSISLAKADGSDLREVLQFHIEGAPSDFPYYPIITWAQDSSKVVAALPATDPMASAQQEASFWLIPLDGSEAYKAGSMQTVFAPNWLFFSPNLDYVLYVLNSSDAGSNKTEIHLARMDATDDRVVAEAQDYLMAYGWTGPESFLYGGGEARDVVEMQVDSAAQTLAPDVAGVYDVRYAGNGDVLFIQGNGPLWTMSLAADGSIFPVDSGGGGSQAALDIDW